jgi:asparagine synthase (glutamine-hydrolysing)
MCGISGILGRSEHNNYKIQSILDVQHHRGPDAKGMWEGDGIVFGHNRLSIIDLSEDANQPMKSNCGRYVLVFNGEIYNYLELKNQLTKSHEFRTSSDTEVLLAAYQKWGLECLNRLNGMFAFAIFDNHSGVLTLARDRFGVKPLNYSIHNGQLIFASEIKSLWKVGVPKQINEEVLGQYLKLDSYGGLDESFWSGVYKLPGGHYIQINESQIPADGAQLCSELWYDFENRVKQYEHNSFSDSKNQLNEILKDAVALRFRADVPVGLNLSGGLDSSALLAIIKELNHGTIQNLEAFTFYCKDERYDELLWVNEMVEKTQVHLNPCLFDSHKVPDMVEQMCYFQDEPYGGFPTLAYSETFRIAREKGILVLLDGSGIDEALAGYDYYQTSSNSLIQGVGIAKNFSDFLSSEFERSVQSLHYPSLFETELLDKQYRDIFYTKIPRSLRFNDRISMMHSTELREPFLDYRLMEFGFSLPLEMKIQQGKGKWILRELIKDLVGPNIALAPKRPLQTPQREWIFGELRDYVGDILEKVSGCKYLDEQKVRNSWQQYLSGETQSSFHIWKMINLYYLLK